MGSVRAEVDTIIKELAGSRSWTSALGKQLRAARNSIQAELARKQMATLRAIMHNGISRGGYTYKGPWHLLARLRKLWKRDEAVPEALAVVETP